MSSEFPIPVFQPYLDSYLECSIVQALVTGLYTHLLYRTICSAVPGLRDGQHRVLVVVLILLYALNIFNLAISWALLRSIVISNNETRQSMATKLFLGSHHLYLIADVTCILGMVITDALLAWRCYIIWFRTRWVLALFGLLLLGEIVLFPTLLLLKPALPGGNDPIAPMYFLSVGITIIATLMIICRIISVSRTTGSSGRYRYIIEIMVESGMMYSILLLITGILQGVATALEAGVIISGVVVPFTGIAPTMIFDRILNGTEEDEAKWSQPISILQFRRTTRISGVSAGQSQVAPAEGLATEDRESV